MKKIFIFLIILFFLRIFFLHPTFSDETFYFNIAKQFSEGKILYKDFFFAHPPIQILILTFLFKIFEPSFLFAKIFTLTVSTLCVYFLFLISKEIYDKKTAIFSSIFFVVLPPFISFSLIGYGMWETMFFLLISVFFALRKKLVFSSFFFSLSFFTRYVALIYFPFLLILFALKKVDWRRFFIFFVTFSVTLFSIFFYLFGFNFFDQTLFFHFLKFGTSKMQIEQYLRMGFFNVLLALASLNHFYSKKEKIGFFLSLTPIIADGILLLVLKVIFYHYFLLSLPFLVISLGRVFSSTKLRSVKILILVTIFSSIFFNFKSIDFYLNPSHAEKFYSLAKWVEENVSEKEEIFGEPIMTNYVSFVTNRRIAMDCFDSYTQHLMREKKIVEKLKIQKPKALIEMELEGRSYYQSYHTFQQIFVGYNLVKVVEGIPTYFIYIRST